MPGVLLRSLTVGILLALSASGWAQEWDVEIVPGPGLMNVSAGPTHSASGSPAIIGADELLDSLNVFGSAELNTGTGGPGPGDITSADISVSGTYTFATPGALTLDADNNVNLGVGGILLNASGFDAPAITVNALRTITLGDLTAKTDSGIGGAISLNAGRDITTSSIDTRSVTGDGGSLTVSGASSARTFDLGQVNTGSDALATNQNSGNGGAIVIGARDTNTFSRLAFTELNSASVGDALAGEGGPVSVFLAFASAVSGGSVVTSSSAIGDTGSGGNVLFDDSSVFAELTLNTIDTGSQSLGGAGAAGNGGRVQAFDFGGITIANIDTSVISPNGSGGNAGPVTLEVDGGGGGSGLISVGTITATSEVATGGNGNRVRLVNASGSINVTGGIDTSATAGNGGAIDILNFFGAVSLGNSTLNSSGNLNGGAITVMSESDTVSFGGTMNSAGGSNDGTITFASESLEFTGATDSINRGAAQAVLRTGRVDTPILVGSAPGPSATDLVLDDTIFAAFAASTGHLRIGAHSRTATITVESDFIKKSPVIFQQPTMVAGGSYTGSIAFADRIEPGTSLATVDFSESITFEASATLGIELGGTVAGSDFDQVTVGDTANLAGTLDLSYTDAFVASPGDSFIVLDAGTLNGTFDAVSFPDGQSWFVIHDSSNGTVTVGVCLADIDGDGICDDADDCPHDPGKTNPGVCGCGVADIDSDGDGVVDCEDGCPFDAARIIPSECGCGVTVGSDVPIDPCDDGDACTRDACVEGVCQNTPLSEVPMADDGCDDGNACTVDRCDPLGDSFICENLGASDGDADIDLDGVSDACDNCIEQFNPDQSDTDGDGYGDVCDADVDNNCRIDIRDILACIRLFGRADATCDRDGDGLVGISDLRNMINRLGRGPGPSCCGNCPL